jgi:hypothetical protein
MIRKNINIQKVEEIISGFEKEFKRQWKNRKKNEEIKFLISSLKFWKQEKKRREGC